MRTCCKTARLCNPSLGLPNDEALPRSLDDRLGYFRLRVDFEDRIPSDVLSALSGRGHEPQTIHGWTATFGGAQMIRMEPWGTLTVAADPRREAYGMAY